MKEPVKIVVSPRIAEGCGCMMMAIAVGILFNFPLFLDAVKWIFHR